MSNLQNVLDERNKVSKFENEIFKNTREVFEIIKNNFKSLEEYTSESISIQTDSSVTIEVEISNQVLGCAIVEGISFIKDEKIVPENLIEKYKMSNFKDMVLSSDYGRLFTGMIVMYTKLSDGPNVVLSRFYVNRNKEVFYRSEIGWFNYNTFIYEIFKEKAIECIISSIEDGLFEIKSYWKEEQKHFESISELSNGNKIGFIE